MLDSGESGKIRRGLIAAFVANVVSRLERFAEGVSVGAVASCSGRELVQSDRYLGARDRFALCFGVSLYGNTILVIDPHELHGDVSHWLERRRLRSQNLGTLSRAAQVIEAGVHQVGLVVIDLDSCGGIAGIATDLIAFRLKFVDTPVVLISAESLVDDFSTERLAVGDVTLRGPVSVSRLDLALAEAQINNQVWQSRNRAPLQ